MATAKVGRGRTGCMQGRFIPKNKGKYVGNANNIIFRSSWELHLMKYLDNSPNCVRWGSEELAIPYVNPIKVDSAGRPVISRYFPDFIAMMRDGAGTITKQIIEIKPFRETHLTAKSSQQDKMTFAVNQAKWRAAADYAARNNAKFLVLTEKSLFAKRVKKEKPNMNEPTPIT